MNLNNYVRGIKDSAISVGVKKIVNNYIRDYGDMVNLKVDSKKKNIELDVLLKGENENIRINIKNYEIVTKDGSNFIKFENVAASREWIEVLINNVAIPSFAPNKAIEIDSTNSIILNLLL